MKPTGPDPEKHQLIDLGILPLDRFLDPHPEFILYSQLFKVDPNEVETGPGELPRNLVARAVLHGQDEFDAARSLHQWFQALRLNFRKKLVPLCYNWAHDRMFLIKWLGMELFQEIFADEVRDPLAVAQFLNDRACCRAEPIPFSKTKLTWLAHTLKVTKIDKSILAHCYEVAQIYKQLLLMC